MLDSFLPPSAASQVNDTSASIPNAEPSTAPGGEAGDFALARSATRARRLHHDGNSTVKIQHSVDNSVWVYLITFAVVATTVVSAVRVLDGASGKDEPLGWYDFFTENPSSENTPQGYVYSANNQPTAVNGVLYPGYFAPESRSRRITDLLEAQLAAQVLDGLAEGGKIEAGCGHGRETGAEVRIILPDIGVNACLFPIINCHCRCIAQPKCAS